MTAYARVEDVGAYKCRSHGFEIEANSIDDGAFVNDHAFLNGGFGFDLHDTGGAGLPQDLYFERCGSSKNILGQVHVALTNAANRDSGNTLAFQGGRVHDSGIYGKWFVEGGH